MASVIGPWMLVAAIALAQAPATLPPTATQIAAAVARLGDERFSVREQAMDELWLLGDAAEPALRAALQNPDAEIRVRAAAVLERFKSGHYPDTPPESVALIAQYRGGRAADKQRAIEQLKDKEDWRTLNRLMKSEADANLRTQLANALRGELFKKVATAIESHDITEVERLLREEAPPGDLLAQRQRITLYCLQGNLADRIADARRDVDAKDTPEGRRYLSSLLIANGQSVTAEEVQESTPGVLSSGFNHLVMAHQWAEVASRYEEYLVKQPARFDNLAYAAMYHRLAGNDKRADERLEEAIRTATPEQAWYVQELLLLHGKVDRALEKLKEIRPSMAFEILCVRQEFEAAFAIADVRPGRSYDAAWFEALPCGDAPPGDANQQNNRRHILALQAAFFLHQVGNKNDADAIFALLREISKTTPPEIALWRRSELCRIQLRVGLEDQAFADAAEFLRTTGNAAIIPSLFGRQGAIAQHWDGLLVAHDASVSEVERLNRLRRLLRPVAAQKKPDDWKPFVEIALASLPEEKGGPRFQRVEAIVDVYLAHDQRQAAVDMLSKPNLSSLLYLRGGDLLREDRRFDEAITCYSNVVPGDVHYVLAIYLRGACDIAAGRQAQGRKLQERSLLLAVDNAARTLLFTGLVSRQMRSDATDVCKLWIRTSPELNATLCKEYGDAIAVEEPQLAAAFWEQLLVRLTSTSASLTEDAGYIALKHAIHRAKLKAALLAGKKDVYERELNTCQSILPNDWAMLDEIIPKMDETGWKKEADLLFEEQSQRLRALTKKFPDSARFSNGLAWISATAKRNLDEALAEAERTQKLAPDNASYLDTLAEVHFARGDVQQAVEIQRRVVELAPQALFRERLARFEAALSPQK